MLKLYYFPGSAALTAHMLLEEVNAAYTSILVNRVQGDLDQPWFRELNPFGRIPVIVDGGQTVFETGPVLTYIAEKHADGGMIPPTGTIARTRFNQWLSLLASDIQQSFMVRSYPHRWIAGDTEQAALVAAAERKLSDQFDIVESLLADGPYILGETVSAADFYLFLLTGYGRRLTPKAWDRPAIGLHYRTMLKRNSVQKAMEIHGLEWN